MAVELPVVSNSWGGVCARMGSAVKMTFGDLREGEGVGAALPGAPAAGRMPGRAGRATGPASELLPEPRMNTDEPYRRYQELQACVRGTAEAPRQVRAGAALVEPHLPALVNDFYAEIERHPDARKVITGGAEQIERLKGTLLTWLRELLCGRYDADYVARRWR